MKHTRSVSHSVMETVAFAKKYVGDIADFRSRTQSEARPQGAFILGLYGNLGSGKTTFTQALAAALGVTDRITSPTFVIEKIYPIINSLSTNKSQSSAQSNAHGLDVFTHLVHIDAYRIERAEEMKHLGWNEIAANPRNLIVIEWPEKIADILPENHSRLVFTFIDETTREIEMVQ